MRLIDADALEDAVNDMDYDVISSAWDRCDGFSAAKVFNMIAFAPTVDAVPVIRCKDCKYWWKENGLCMHKRHTDGNLCIHACGRDSFCSDGEKKVKQCRQK